MTKKALQCPFCGIAPRVRLVKHDTGALHWVMHIECDNPYCTVKPELHLGSEVKAEVEAEAYLKWNHRADVVELNVKLARAEGVIAALKCRISRLRGILNNTRNRTRNRY